MSDNKEKKISPFKNHCPICGKEPVFQFKPFCSKRCADIDLNRWLSGVYRIETNETPQTINSEVETEEK